MRRPSRQISLKECYEVLRLEKGADLQAVKRAYRRRAFELHPDLNPGNPEAGRQFQILNEAYVALTALLKPAEDAKRAAAAEAEKTTTADTADAGAASGAHATETADSRETPDRPGGRTARQPARNRRRAARPPVKRNGRKKPMPSRTSCATCSMTPSRAAFLRTFTANSTASRPARALRRRRNAPAPPGQGPARSRRRARKRPPPGRTPDSTRATSPGARPTGTST